MESLEDKSINETITVAERATELAIEIQNDIKSRFMYTGRVLVKPFFENTAVQPLEPNLHYAPELRRVGKAVLSFQDSYTRKRNLPKNQGNTNILLINKLVEESHHVSIYDSSGKIEQT